LNYGQNLFGENSLLDIELLAMEMKKKIILVDSNNIAYRAFYALPQTIATSAGTMTNAVLGFTSMILKLLEEQKPDIIICAFDSKGPTFRHELFEEYKATRKKMPDELIGQMPLIKEVLESLNISVLAMEGFEADDIIATLTGSMSCNAEEIIIVSCDKDILQLVSDNVKVMALKQGITNTVLYDEAKVIEKFGVKPDRIKELLALMGDSSDNIPGVSGIGPKTALELIMQFGTIEGIYENIEDVKKEKLKNLLIENEGDAKKSRTLIELNSSLQIDIQAILEKSAEGFDMAKADSVFNLLEFNALKKRLKYATQNRKTVALNAADTSLPGSSQSGASGLNSTASGTPVLSSPENKKNTDSSSGYNAPISKKKLNKGMADGKVFLEEKKLYIALSQTGFLLLMDGLNNYYIFDSQTFNDPPAIRELATLLENSEIIKSGFDLKQIYKFLGKHGINMQGRILDYKILYLLLNAEKSGISLEELFLEITGIDILSAGAKSPGFEITDFNNPMPNHPHGRIGNYKATGANDNLKDHNQMAFSFEEDGAIDSIIPPKKSGGAGNSGSCGINSGSGLIVSPDFNACTGIIGSSGVIDGFGFENPEKLQEDNTIATLMEALMYYPQIDKILSEKIAEEELDSLYDTIEGPLVKVLADMEFKGVNIDRQYLGLLVKEYTRDIDGLTKEIYDMCGSEFNINSTQQLAEILYKRLNLSTTKKTKTGFSTNAASLFAIRDSHPVIGRILDYREKVKLKNTYIDVLPNLADPVDGRVHATYNQLGTTTGRISSNNPNLQNIPVRTELGKQIRKAFIPGKAYDYLISADYSQIELRILAHLSQDEDLISAFNSGQDIHTRTASEIFAVNYEDVDENLRRKAKAINFGIIYGMTEFGLKSRLSISEEEAREYIRLYFARYPKVKRYINFLIETAYKTGMATTMFGRKRYLKELASTNANFRSLGERFAVNTPIQGSAADIMKLATVVLFNEICRQKLDCNIILHVHDEIVLEFRKEDTDIVKNLVINSLENCVELVTKLKVDVKIAENWYI
jgi:DNA polymerase-1